MPLIIPSNSISALGYNVDNSLRFDDGSSDHLTRTLSTPTNNKIFTLSFWTKLTKNDSNAREIIAGGTDGANETFFRHAGGYGIQFRHDHSTETGWNLVTSRVFRDPSAWYHFVASIDTTQATASNRIKFYVNGVQETSFSTENYPAQNEGTFLNTNAQITIGKRNYDSSVLFDGYLAEFVLIDGQALDPTSFGETDEDTGIWKPIDVSGLTFGTNGFYLDFENSGSLGADVSGNGNNFTVNNLTSIDQTTDTCTNNFATLNPLATNINTSSSNFSEGNLELDRPGATANWVGCVNTMGVTQGKWYAEYKVIDAGDPTNGVMIGVTNVDLSNFQNGGNDLQQSGEYGINYYAGGQILNDGSTVATYTAMSDGDIVMIALDIDNGKIYWGRNGTWENSGDPTSGATGTGAQNLSEISTGYTYCFNLACREDGNVQANYGNPPFSISSGNSDGNGYGNFEYSVPSGYYSLNTKNLSEYG